MISESCLTNVVLPNRCVPKNTIVELIRTDPAETKLNCKNFKRNRPGEVTWYFENDQKLLRKKFQMIDSSEASTAARNV